MFCLKVIVIILLLVTPYNIFGQGLRSGKTFEATSYCLPGITKQGHKVRRGIIAVDPEIIPLNTVVFIESPKSARGYYIASDTGRVIKGDIIDIWVPTCREAIKWGRRNVRLVVNPAITDKLAAKLKRGAPLDYKNLLVHLGTRQRQLVR